MTGRISIPALRAELGDSDQYFSRWEVRALVEAVEAQRAYILACGRSAHNRNEREVDAASERLLGTLARFDFGEET